MSKLSQTKKPLTLLKTVLCRFPMHQLLLAVLWGGVFSIFIAACTAQPKDVQDFAPLRTTKTPNVSVGTTALPQPTQIQVPTPTLIYELPAGQHISHWREFVNGETASAGPMVCQIKRNTCAFNNLAIYESPTIFFGLGEEPPFDLEDKYMHPIAAERLEILEQLVWDEWGGTSSIMVTEAYDSQGSHDLTTTDHNAKYSLHFEGRSLDLIPWPPDLDKMARLCALSHEAGFDWVHNEGDHCHVSVVADTLCGRC